MSEKSPRSGTQILAKVSEVAFETDRLPSEAEADQILRAENIDVTDLQSWISDRLVGVRARQKLRKAPERRLALIEKLAKNARKSEFWYLGYPTASNGKASGNYFFITRRSNGLLSEI